MSRVQKILIGALAAAVVLLGGVTLWLHLSKPRPQTPPEPTAVPTPMLPEQSRGELIISEFMEKNRTLLRDGDGDFPDWIELYNPGAEPVALKDWSISDKESGEGWRFPEVSVGAGEYLLVFASGKDRRGGELHTDFAVSGDEGLYLKDATGKLRGCALCGGCDKDVSMALTAEGTYAPSLYPTPGYENSAAGYEALQQTLMPAGPLVINEAMVWNNSYLWQGDRGYCDWVEIKNISGSAVWLGDYYLSDDDGDYRLWQLPEQDLAPGAMLLVLCDGEALPLRGELAFANFSLDSENEQLYLSDGQGLVDCLGLRDIPMGGSAGRMDGLPGCYYFAKPSPGENNRNGYLRVSAQPVSLRADGVFDAVDAVTAELSAAGEIRYTLDGSAPTEGSALYTGELTITKTCVLRAASFEEGALPSRPLTLSYIINEGHSLPVVSLAADSPEEFRQMYSAGAKDVEQPGSLSYYGPDGSFTIGCGVSMNGMTSLILPKKNMALRFRGAYGDSTLNYDLYGGGVTEFTNLLLRAGQDFDSAIVRNELCQELCALTGDNVINQRSRFVILYMNGEYSGIYTLKEKANEQLYASIAGVSRDSVELLEPLVDFQSEFYQEIIRFSIMNDMTLESSYRHICDRVDIDSLIDFLIMEGFCANTDVTMGNMRFVRSPEADNKWRFEFYDLDAAFNHEGSMYYNLMSGYSYENIQISGFIVPLMRNAEFKDAFLTRANQLFRDVLTNQTVVDTLDRLCLEIAPEVARDYGRFNRSVADWEYDVELIRRMVEDHNWRQLNIDALSDVFDLSDEEREKYFGEIDGK